MNLKKILSISTIACFCISACILITGIFGVSIFEGVLLCVLVTFACLAVGGFFTINALNLLDKNKPLSIASMSLIAVSVLGILIITYFDLNSDLFGSIIFTLALISVLFNVVVNNALSLGKRLLPLQIAVYAVIFACITLAVLSIFGVALDDALSKVLISLIVLSVVGVIILAVVKKRQPADLSSADKVTISRAEYDTLLAKASAYDTIQAQNQSH